jgi:CRP-like cAMP-binding protein
VALPATSNLLLGALSDPDYRRIEPHLEFVTLTPGQVIFEPGEGLTHFFFPAEGIVSVRAGGKDQSSMEIAIIGNEGIVGSSLLIEDVAAPAPQRSIVQVGGHAYRLRAELLMEELARGGELRRWLLRYRQALITQIAQIAVCGRRHPLEARLCRWLLQRVDRLARIELYVTQDEMAALLGVSRECVVEAMSHLQGAGLIRHGRSHVTVLDRAGLKLRACECLAVIQKEYGQLLCV